MPASTREFSSSAPDFLQLIGHPLRWKLLASLGESDRLVHELMALTGQPQNLVSYHLAKLRDAHLVRARQSSADRRDTYYTADLGRLRDGLTATGAALHAALQWHPAPANHRANTRATRARVLFLCTGNSARSQMAQALIKARSAGKVQALSAGSEPKVLHPHAIRVMREEFGIDISKQNSHHFRTYLNQRFDVVITLCDRVKEVCPEFPGEVVPMHWSMANPATEEAATTSSYAAFQQTAKELDERISFLLPVLMNSPSRLVTNKNLAQKQLAQKQKE